MNREFLKNAGIADEAIEKIMAEYGRDVQTEKDKARQSEAAAESARKELDAYKAKVTELEKAAGNNDTVRKELDDLKAKIAKDKQLADERAADEALTSTIKAAFPQGRKFVNEYTEAAMIGQIKAELSKSENRGKGISEILTALTKDKTGIFENPNKPGNMAGFGGSDIDSVNDAEMRAIMGLPAKESK